MTDADLKGALEALALTEVDADDIRLLSDPDHGTLLIATFKTVKAGTNLVLVAKQKNATQWTRLRLSQSQANGLFQTLSQIED
jgi:hypothetical protein